MDTPEQSPRERLSAALEDFATEQRAAAAIGIQPFDVPDIGTVAAVNALIVVLTEKGLITDAEYEDAVLNQRAALLEDLARQARALKRQHSGLVMPGTILPSGAVSVASGAANPRPK